MDREKLIFRTRRAGEVFDSPELIDIADLCERLTAEVERLEADKVKLWNALAIIEKATNTAFSGVTDPDDDAASTRQEGESE